MMEFKYLQPRADIRTLVGSYYDVSVPDGYEDVMRAEIANIRFVIAGTVHSDINGQLETYSAGDVIICGPTYQWSNVVFNPGSIIFGAAITPLGWARMFDVPAIDYIPADKDALIQAVLDAGDPTARAEQADALFAALTDPTRRVHEDFLDIVTAWITNPEPNELDDLLSAVDLSARQVERLTKFYFGSAPKKLHRKFRALHSANRLTWQQLTDWRDIATTAYFDQSHFIREFKQFNGRTPSDFINGPHLLVRMTLEERRQIAHESPFSLVG